MKASQALGEGSIPFTRSSRRLLSGDGLCLSKIGRGRVGLLWQFTLFLGRKLQVVHQAKDLAVFGLTPL